MGPPRVEGGETRRQVAGGIDGEIQIAVAWWCQVFAGEHGEGPLETFDAQLNQYEIAKEALL